MFGCIEFSGWIDKSQMMRVIERVYPNYFSGHFNNTIDVPTFWKEVSMAQMDAKLHVFIGNQDFVEPVEAGKKSVLMTDLLVNLVFCEFFIFHLPIDWREKLRMNFIMLFQTLPLLIDLVLYNSYDVSILAFYIALSHMLIYVTYATSSFVQNRWPHIYKLVYIFLANFILILIPILGFQVVSLINLSYKNSLKKLEEHCYGKTRTVQFYSQSIGEYMDDDMQAAKLKTIFSAEYIDAYKDLYRLMNSFGRMNFRQAFFKIYGYMLAVLSLVPLVTETFFWLLKGSYCQKERMFLVILLCIGLVVSLCFFVPESYSLDGISWDSKMGVFFDRDDMMGDTLGSSMEVYRSSKKITSDLNGLTKSRIEWIQKELSDRLPTFLSSYEGVVTCQSLRYAMLEVFHNFRKQFITIFQFKLTICYYFSAFTPLFIFFYISIFF